MRASRREGYLRQGRQNRQGNFLQDGERGHKGAKGHKVKSSARNKCTAVCGGDCQIWQTPSAESELVTLAGCVPLANSLDTADRIGQSNSLDSVDRIGADENPDTIRKTADAVCGIYSGNGIKAFPAPVVRLGLEVGSCHATFLDLILCRCVSSDPWQTRPCPQYQPIVRQYFGPDFLAWQDAAPTRAVFALDRNGLV